MRVELRGHCVNASARRRVLRRILVASWCCVRHRPISPGHHLGVMQPQPQRRGRNPCGGSCQRRRSGRVLALVMGVCQISRTILRSSREQARQRTQESGGRHTAGAAFGHETSGVSHAGRSAVLLGCVEQSRRAARASTHRGGAVDGVSSDGLRQRGRRAAGLPEGAARGGRLQDITQRVDVGIITSGALSKQVWWWGCPSVSFAK